MAKITDIKQSVNSRIRVKNQPNSITTGDVSDNLDLIADEVRARGIIKSVNTAGLAAISGTNTKFALVSAIGLFEYSPGGVPNGSTIFAAEGSGTWNMVLGLPEVAKDSFNIDANYVYNLDASMKIDQIVLKPSVDQTAKIGFTDGGEDVLMEEIISAGTRKSISIQIFGDENPSIYFNGFNASTEVTVYKSKI